MTFEDENFLILLLNARELILTVLQGSVNVAARQNVRALCVMVNFSLQWCV